MAKIKKNLLKLPNKQQFYSNEIIAENTNPKMEIR
jgi:hypothetical protein